MVESRLESQLKLEKSRHFEKYGTSEGYLPRFVFGRYLNGLFRKASKTTFQGNKRNPVGLNPERFVAKCKQEGCARWLIDAEYGTEYFDDCLSKKPSAKKQQKAP